MLVSGSFAPARAGTGAGGESRTWRAIACMHVGPDVPEAYPIAQTNAVNQQIRIGVLSVIFLPLATDLKDI